MGMEMIGASPSRWRGNRGSVQLWSVFPKQDADPDAEEDPYRQVSFKPAEAFWFLRDAGFKCHRFLQDSFKNLD